MDFKKEMFSKGERAVINSLMAMDDEEFDPDLDDEEVESDDDDEEEEILDS